jgi:hypothetical protein
MAICLGTTALLVSGCRSSDRARLDVGVDASESSFPASWHMRVQESRSLGDQTTGKVRAVPAADGVHSAVFHLRGRGRYRIGVDVEPLDHSTGSGCARQIEVPRDAHYSATIRLHANRTCSVVVRHRSHGASS